MKMLLRMFAALLCAAFAPIAALAQNYSDIWWNSAESGWGLTIADHQSNLFAVWFTYRQDGKPTWYVIPGGTFTNNRQHFEGDIYATTGPAYSSAPFDASRVTVSKVGTATIDFASSGGGTFGYSLAGITQSKAIQRQPFGNAAPAWGGDVTDIWYNPNESGWGLTLAQHGNDVFGVWFTYDTDGQPLWAVMPGVTFDGSTAFTGNLYTTTGPYFGSVPFDSSRVVVTQQGNASVTLASGAGAQCSGQQTGTFAASFRGTSVQKATCHQPFGDSPATTSVDAPSPMALPPGTPKQQAAAFADALANAADSRTRLAAWLGLYEAVGLPVLDDDGNSVNGTGDDVVGAPYWSVWYASGMDQPNKGGVRMSDAAVLLTLQGDGTTIPDLGGTLLKDLQAAAALSDPQEQLLAYFVRERVLRGPSHVDILATATQPGDATVDLATMHFLLWSLQRASVIDIARAAPKAVELKAGPLAASKAGSSMHCKEMFGSKDVTKWVNTVVGKLGSGAKLPFKDTKLFEGMRTRLLNVLGVGADAQKGIDKTVKWANAGSSLLGFLAQIYAMNVGLNVAPDKLVRTKETTYDNNPQVIGWRLYYDKDKVPGGNELWSCMSSYFANSLGLKFTLPQSDDPIPGAEIIFQPGHNIPGKVLFDENGTNYVITTDKSGVANLHMIGRHQPRALPANAKSYSDTYSMVAMAQPEGITADSITNHFLDSFFAALGPLEGAAAGKEPDWGSIGPPFLAPMINIMKTLHYDLGEFVFDMVDWTAGYEVDYTEKDTHIFGLICNGLEQPFTLGFDSGGLIKGNLAYTPASAAQGTVHLTGQTYDGIGSFVGDGTYSILGTPPGDQQLKFSIPSQTATFPGATVQVAGVASTMPLLPTDKCAP
jgi:hypothetical protein